MIKKGMYGLKQAAILAYKHFVKLLAPHGYCPCPNTTGLWKHDTRPTKFCLYVNDFGVKYFSHDDANHLLDALKQHYKIFVYYEGKNYCGLTMEWNYQQGYVDISMPKYIPAMIKKLQHPQPKKPQYAPHQWVIGQFIGAVSKWHQLMIPNRFPQKASTESNLLSVPFYITPEPSTPPCYHRSTISAVSKQLLPQVPTNHAPCSLIMLRLILMQK